jgi:hypothetical protein
MPGVVRAATPVSMLSVLSATTSSSSSCVGVGIVLQVTGHQHEAVHQLAGRRVQRGDLVRPQLWGYHVPVRRNRVVGDSKIALINSHCKLATRRRGNRKIRYENEIHEASEHAPEG